MGETTVQARAEHDVKARICFIMHGRLAANQLSRCWRDLVTQEDYDNAAKLMRAGNTNAWIDAQLAAYIIFPGGWFTAVKEESYLLSPREFAAKEAQRWLWENRVLADRLMMVFMRASALADEFAGRSMSPPDMNELTAFLGTSV